MAQKRSITPFRYPGAKSKWLPKLMVPIAKILEKKGRFSDCFVGGGSVLLEVAAKYPKAELFANDKDRGVYCFWKIVADSNRSQLDKLFALMQTKPTIKLFNELRQDFDTADEVQCAYRCIFFNRTTFSGIARSGPIGGHEQKSKYTVDCRYNAGKLIKKIEQCRKLLVGRTTVESYDIKDYPYLIHSHEPAYLDPPYYIKGDMLYTEKMNEFDHQNMANILKQRDNWVLSYDDCPEVRQFYQGKNIEVLSVRYCINGEKEDWKETGELIITP